MNEVIHIENGRVTLLEQKVVKTCALSAFEEQLAATLGVRTPLLPEGCVLYAKNGEKACYLLEQKPARREILYQPREGRAKAYTLPIPWCYMAVSFHQFALERLHVFFARRQVRAGTDMLCFAPLPNIANDCSVCLGEYRFGVTASVPDRIRDVVRFFWESTFNNDIMELHLNRMPEAVRVRTRDAGDLFSGWSDMSLEEAGSVAWEACWPVNDAVKRATS